MSVEKKKYELTAFFLHVFILMRKLNEIEKGMGQL